MANITSVDSSSPFFSSLAGQSEVQNERQKSERAVRKRSEPASKSFKSVFDEQNRTTSMIAGNLLLEKIRGKTKEDALQILLADVENTGAALAEKPFANQLLQYKQSVQAFIHFIVENSYTIETVSSRDTFENRMKRKTKSQSLIQIVDAKLERLASDIISNQQDRLRILERVGEIRGILVNIAS